MTTIEETLTKLHEMRLASMALAVRELMESAPGHQLSFEEKLGIVVDREWNDRDNRRLSRRIKEAKLASVLRSRTCSAIRNAASTRPASGSWRRANG